MLTADQISYLRDRSEQLLDPIIEFLVEDICKRVTAAGQFTSTASYQIWRAQNLGISQRKLKKEIAKRLKISQQQAEKLLTQSAEVGYNFDISRFPTSHAIPLSANSSLQQILSATVALAKDDLTNMTQTIGFVGTDGVCRELTDAYNQACDFAFQKISTGAQDYMSAIRDATKNLAEKGIRWIDYESGVHTSLEAAVRRNMMGALGLMQEQISQSNYDMLGCDGWEISAHEGSAPDHEPYQGKQYPNEAYKRLNNSLKRRIGTLNCGHYAFCIILGVNEPQYTDEELEAMRRRNEEGVTYEGKHYTLNEAQQKQRKFERTIRKQKRRILVDESLGDKERLQTDQIKLVRLQDEYIRFSKGTGQRTQYARMETEGFNWKHAKAAEKAASSVGKGKTSQLILSKKDENIQSSPKINQVSEPVMPVAEPIPSALSQGFIDITDNWYPEAVPNSHPVRDLQEYVVDGVSYKVDGRNVQLDYKPHEKEIAELLEREVGGEIFMVPRVNNPQGISTPDYIFNGKAYDLKTLSEEATENTIFNRVKKARKQAHNFIIDVSDAALSDEVVEKQLKKLFENNSTVFVEEVVIIRNGAITKVVKRKKS